MILISASLPKSGSTLIANYQEDLLAALFPSNGQAQLRKAFQGRFIGSLNPIVIARLLAIHARHGTIVVKTHSAATPLLRALINAGVARATYCYRDPRDVVLSSIDHGKRSRAGEDPARAFIDYTTIDDAIPKVQSLIQRWQSWHIFGKAQMIRYEELMADKLGSLRAMAGHLGWGADDQLLNDLVARHTPKKGVSYNFNKGTTLRYQTEMTPEEIARCTRAFRDILVQYQYEV